MHLYLSHTPPSGGLGCCPLYRNGSTVVDLLFNVLSIVCGRSVFVFVLHFFVSILVLQSF